MGGRAGRTFFLTMLRPCKILRPPLATSFTTGSVAQQVRPDACTRNSRKHSDRCRESTSRRRIPNRVAHPSITRAKKATALGDGTELEDAKTVDLGACVAAFRSAATAVIKRRGAIRDSPEKGVDLGEVSKRTDLGERGEAEGEGLCC